MTCRSFKGYEEVRVPPLRNGAAAADEKLVLIEEMEEWAQLAFQGYKWASPAFCFPLSCDVKVHQMELHTETTSKVHHFCP